MKQPEQRQPDTRSTLEVLRDLFNFLHHHIEAKTTPYRAELTHILHDVVGILYLYEIEKTKGQAQTDQAAQDEAAKSVPGTPAQDIPMQGSGVSKQAGDDVQEKAS